jgi:hypothetical protein
VVAKCRKDDAYTVIKRSLKRIMKAKLEQFPAKNPNPVLSVAKDGTVIYSNEAGEPLLNEWGISVGEKLPPHIENIVHRILSRNTPAKIEIKVGIRV